MTVTIDVYGTPAPEGSHKAFVNKATGRAHIVHDSKRLAPWREAVKYAARRATHGEQPFPSGAVRVSVTVYVRRPKSHYGTGRNAGIVKDSAPLFPSTRVDLDKQVRVVFDGITDAGVWGDDSQVVMLSAHKCYADARHPGAAITIDPMDDDEVRAVFDEITDFDPMDDNDEE